MNTFLAIFFNTQKCVNKKQAKKVFHHTSREKKIIAKNRASLFRWKVFCMNNLFSLLHDASLKAAVFSGCTFWRFHIFRFWNYPIIGNFHFALKKCGNTTQRKGRRICLVGTARFVVVDAVSRNCHAKIYKVQSKIKLFNEYFRTFSRQNPVLQTERIRQFSFMQNGLYWAMNCILF